jgi:NUMOD3 motif
MHASSNIQFICANCHEDKTRIELSEKGAWNKGKPFSAESRRRMSEAAMGNTRAHANRGHKDSVETRQKKSAAGVGNTHGFKKGFTPWNKGRTGSTPWNKGMIYGDEMRKRVTGRPKLRIA